MGGFSSKITSNKTFAFSQKQPNFTEKVMKVDKGYNDDRLRAMYPNLAIAFERVLNDNPKLGLRLRYLYYSRYNTSRRSGKTLSLGRIIDAVRENGYHVDVDASEIKSPDK